MLNFNFTQFDNDDFLRDFKEDSVREFIISPLLKELGFRLKDSKESINTKETKVPKLEMSLSLKITSPTILGSNEKITLTRFPDYVLYFDSKPHCVLDAKAPNIAINSQSKAERQGFYYAINPELKTPFYALCNGRNFTLFETNGQNLLKEFSCKDIFANHFENENFTLLKQYLTTPIESLRQDLRQDFKTLKKPDSWYLDRKLPKEILKPQKQTKARYYGCTAYFTRQSWDVVTQNIKNFTDEGDIVLDSFGGSGVTAIEAMMNGRLGIHTDLNPLSIFITKALSAKVDLNELYDLSEEILKEFENLKPKTENEAKEILKNAKYYPNAIDIEFGETASQKEQDNILWIPKDEILPKGSDVDSVFGLFSKIQLAELAILRKLIFKKTMPSKDKANRASKRAFRYSLLGIFKNVLTIHNLTCHTAKTTEQKRKGGLGFGSADSAAMRYYRYRIAKEPSHFDIVDLFRKRTITFINGKKELKDSPHFYQSYHYPINGIIKDFSGSMLNNRESLDELDSKESKNNGEKIFQADATNLKEIESLSIDFIYTDPPYGAKIPYLDLSTMWNAWLDFDVDNAMKEKECIEKGSLDKSRYDYYDLMKQSLKEMYRVLKYNRWLAFVFQHQDPKLFQILVESAENVGFEYMGFVSQENTGVSSFKKVQNPSTVLKGQIILYFTKVNNPKTRTKLEAGVQSLENLYRDIESIIVKSNGASLEAINANLIKMALEGGYHTLMGKFADVIALINERFDYDEDTKLYHIRDEASILNYGISIDERARYYILGELTKAQRENRGLDFDSLCLYIIPLLKNGVQANNKMIREILNELAYEKDELWYLKSKELSLFD